MALPQTAAKILKLTLFAVLIASTSTASAATTHSGDLDVNGAYPVTGDFTISGGNLTVQNGGSLAVQSGTGESGDMTIVTGGDATKGNATVYSGGSVVVNGTFSMPGDLQVNSSGGLGANALTVGENIVNAGQITVVTSFTNPSSLFTIQNTGSILVGEDFVNQGRIEGDGTLLAGGSLTCEAGSFLSGHPTLTAPSIYLNGTVDMSGNGAGTTTLGGDTWLAGVSRFDVRLSPLSGSDQFHATGLNTLTIVRNADDSRPTFYLVAPGGTNPQIAERRTLITTDHADGLQLEVRPSVADTLQDYRFILRTDRDAETFASSGQYYYAYLARDGSFEAIGITANQKSFGRYLDTVKDTDDGVAGSGQTDFQWIRDTLDLMTDLDDVRDAMEQLAGMTYAPLSSISMQRQFFQYNQMADRLRRDLVFRPTWGRTLPPEALPPVHVREFESGETVIDSVMTRGQAPDQAPWLTRGQLSGYGFGGDLNSDGNGYGGSYGGGGLQLVYGIRSTPRFQFGTFYQYGGIDYDGDKNGQATINSHDFGGYFTLHGPTDYLLFIAGGGFSNYDVKRTLNFGNDINWINRTAGGDHQGGQATVYAEYGLHFEGPLSGICPYVGLMYMNVTQSAFTETGANGANLALEENRLNSLRTLLGTAWDKPLFSSPSWTVNARALWVHELLRQTNGRTTARLAAIPDETFVILGPGAGRDWGVVGAGLQYLHPNNRSRFYVNGDFMMNGVSNIYMGSAGWEYLW